MNELDYSSKMSESNGDVTCPDIPVFTSMEVGVVLAGQRMKPLKYQTISTIHFFIYIRTELSGIFYLYQNKDIVA